MIATSTSNRQFVIKDYPLGRILLGLGLIVVPSPLDAITILYIPFPPPVKYYYLIVWELFLFGTGVYYLMTSKFRTTIIDANTHQVSVSIGGPLRSKYRSYPFSEIAKSFGGLRVNVNYRSRTQLAQNRSEYKVYGITLPLASGDEIDLTGYASFQHNRCELAIKGANEIINAKS